MKVTRNWLRQYVDFEWSPEELAERLTMLGLEVEAVDKLGGEYQGIVVAEVVTREKHPNADKLSVCRVNDGQGERQIVCGADNFGAGDKVPLILPGASLPPKPGDKAPFTIKVGKIRGVESQGMMCSPNELGVAADTAGLLILPRDARVGQPFAEHLGRTGDDVLYDLEVTPNRPDLNSVIGIAREIAALTGNQLRLPEVTVPTGPVSAVGAEPGARLDHWVTVTVREPALCPRYTARIVQGVTIGPSPDWLKNQLEAIGIRSINNVVDVTNFVMLESGQPLHAFDYHLIPSRPHAQPDAAGAPACLVIRCAAEGEKFVTLDEQERALTEDTLLIADAEKGIALAGIMGGLNSEINQGTRDVLIESACFQPANIRRASKRLGLRTESSYRFERGADIGITDWASRRCAQLILETAGGRLLPGAIDVVSEPAAPREIPLRHSKVDELLGIHVPAADTVKFLTSLGLESVAAADGNQTCTFRVPSWRVDLKREVDLIEEITRLYGVDKIPSTPPRGAVGANSFDSVYDLLGLARRFLTGLGLNEAQGQTLISAEAGKLAAPEDSLVHLSNPLSADMNVLRPSLLPGLLDSLRHNLTRRNNDVALFEIGRVFTRSQGKRNEHRRIAIALTGQRHPSFWSGDDREAKIDIHDLKGLLEEFLDQFGLRGIQYARRTDGGDNQQLFLESAGISIGGKMQLGEFGQLLPTLAKRYDLRDTVFLAELDLDQLLLRRAGSRSFKALPSFPSVRRDVAMVVPEEVTHDAVLAQVRKARPANLESIELFDVFRGKNIPPGSKSLAYALIYRNAERTLTDNEVNQAHEKVVAQLKAGLQASIRES